jgi:hypothetical protein
MLEEICKENQSGYPLQAEPDLGGDEPGHLP